MVLYTVILVFLLLFMPTNYKYYLPLLPIRTVEFKCPNFCVYWRFFRFNNFNRIYKNFQFYSNEDVCLYFTPLFVCSNKHCQTIYRRPPCLVSLTFRILKNNFEHSKSKRLLHSRRSCPSPKTTIHTSRTYRQCL
jgi:hypothetical protein